MSIDMGKVREAAERRAQPDLAAYWASNPIMGQYFDEEMAESDACVLADLSCHVITTGGAFLSKQDLADVRSELASWAGSVDRVFRDPEGHRKDIYALIDRLSKLGVSET